MINMMIIFHFIFKILKNRILKVELSIDLKNISTCTKCLILQNGLHVDEILIFKKFQFSGTLKNNCVSSNNEFYYYNISNCNMK
jgi:hypothetical protein